MACELVPDNSSRLKEILLQHAGEHEQNSEFADWLKSSCIFINTLVDRIVSKLPAEEIESLQKEWNVNDRLMLCAEPYHFLAVDSESLEEVLPLQKAGLNVVVAEGVDGLNTVRERKVKVLNGAHMLLVPAGLDLGLTTVEETLKHEELRSFAEKCLREEIAVTVSDPEIDDYIASVIERFENPFLNHRLENIALNSTAKIVQRLYPSIIDYWNESGRYPHRLLFAVAFFMKFSEGNSGEGCIKTSWGELRDNSNALKNLAEANEKDGIAAARLMTGTEWPVPEEMSNCFIETLGTIIKDVRSKGIENILKEAK